MCWGENSTLRMWGIDLLTGPTPNLQNTKITYLAAGEEYASPEAAVPPGGMPGAFMCLTSDNNKPGTAVLWATVPYLDANRVVSPGRLLAYDINQFKEGPNGAVIPKLWDSADWGPNHNFAFVKFTPPVVSGGKLFLPDYNGSVHVYGLA